MKTIETIQKDVPEAALTFTCGEGIHLMDSPDPGNAEPQKFRINGNTGIPFRHWWWGMFAVDLGGIEVPTDKVAVLGDHRSSTRLGVSGKPKNLKGEGLIFEGEFLSNDDAQKFRQDIKDGFPMQASISVDAKLIEEVLAGETAEVNGHTLQGPGHIFRKSMLREVSMTSLGADHLTEVEALKSGPTVSLSITRMKTMTEKTTKGDSAPEKVTIASLKADHPELVQELEKESFSAGRSAERERVSEILEACHERQTSVALKHIKEGTSVKDTFKALLEDSASFKQDKLEDLKDNAEEALGAIKEEEESKEDFSNLPVEERAKKEWERDAELHKDFDSADEYAAYLKHTQVA